MTFGLDPHSLAFLCALLFVDGATLAAASTVLVLTYGRYHEPWQLAAAGGLAASLGSGIQLAILRWALNSKQPWMQRFAPSRERIDKTLKAYPSASFLALVVARATPLPDAPLKLAAAVIGYPVWLYTLASFIGIAPYFYVLALLGRKFQLPIGILIGALVLVLVGVVVDALRRRRRESATTDSAAKGI